jgi:glycerol-3-phosphate dehydrogenase (NAD+)
MLLSHQETNASNPIDDAFSSEPQISSGQLEKVTIVGSGNWGSAIATKIGRNCESLPYFEDKVNMWVYEEWVEVKGYDKKQKLTEVINTRHENVKYLPGIPLPENIVALSDLVESCRDATIIIFVLPHQYLPNLLPTIREVAHPSCRGVSLIKGIG